MMRVAKRVTANSVACWYSIHACLGCACDTRAGMQTIMRHPCLSLLLLARKHVCTLFYIHTYLLAMQPHCQDLKHRPLPPESRPSPPPAPKNGPRRFSAQVSVCVFWHPSWAGCQNFRTSTKLELTCCKATQCHMTCGILLMPTMHRDICIPTTMVKEL